MAPPPQAASDRPGRGVRPVAGRSERQDGRGRQLPSATGKVRHHLGRVARGTGLVDDQGAAGDRRIPATEPQQVTDAMRAAITESDNAAAESAVGPTRQPHHRRASRSNKILQETGDPTTVESRKGCDHRIHRFRADHLVADQPGPVHRERLLQSANDPIFALMGQVEPQQSWGIGDIPGTQFKGGWGPSPSGKYLVRQIGILNTPPARSPSRSPRSRHRDRFDDGTTRPRRGRHLADRTPGPAARRAVRWVKES